MDILPTNIRAIQPSTLASVGISFDGAAKFDRSIALWRPPFQSADLDMLPHKQLIDTRVRDAVRNDSYVAGANRFYKNNVVGIGYKLMASPKYHVLKKTPEWAKEFKKEVEDKFALWANSPDNWVDASRHTDLAGLLRLAVSSYFSSGEVLATVEWDRNPARPFYTCIQLIDPDRLDSPLEVRADVNMRAGIRFDKYGAPVEYHIRANHPSGYSHDRPFEIKKIKTYKPWGRIQVIHLYELTRPEQSRGVSVLVSALKELNVIKKFRDVVLQNAVVQATYAAVITSELPSDAVYSMLGAGTDADGMGLLEGAVAQTLSVTKQFTDGANNLTIDGTKIPHLPPGTDLKVLTPGQGGPLGTDFESSLLRYLAASLGISYEQLSKDYSKSSYSSARAAMTETWKNMQSIKREVTDVLASHIYRLWLEEAINRGDIDSMRDSADFYEGMNKDAYTNCSWIGAARGQIDELKEGQAASLRIQSNLSSHSREASLQGNDIDEVMEELADEKKRMEELGITLEPNNMMNSVSGKAGQVQANEDRNTGGDEDEE